MSLPLNDMQSLSLSNVSRADGSALYSYGDTVVQCIIYGPSEVSQYKEKTDSTTVEVIFKKKIRPVTRDSADIKQIEDFIRKNLESVMLLTHHPRSLMTIFIHELQNDGSLISCSLNAACSALLDSAFPMKCLLGSVTAIVDCDGTIVVNPNTERSKDSKASFVFTFDSVNENLISFTSEGCFSFGQFLQCLDVSKESSKEIFQFYRNTIEKKFCYNTTKMHVE